MTTTTDTAAAPSPVPVTPPPGFWQREPSHYPLPLTALSRRVHCQTEWIRTACEESGLLVDTLAFQDIGGWRYFSVVPPADVADRVATAVAAARSDLHGQHIKRWHAEWRPALAARASALRDVDLTGLTDSELEEQLSAALAVVDEGGEIHFRLHVAMAVIVGSFARTCRDLLGWTDHRTFELLSGTSVASTEPARALTALADAVKRSPLLRRLLAAGVDTDQVLGADPEFATAFTDYLARYGRRTLSYDLADPTLAERPSLVLGLIREHLDKDPADRAPDVAGRGGSAAASARASLTGRGASARDRFEHDLARAMRAYPVREDNEFVAVSAPLALVRRVALEIGRRLAERGQISSRDDVFHLEAAELPVALRDRADRRPLVGRRQGERAWVLAHPGPVSYGPDPGPPPPLDGLPLEAREANEAFIWAAAHILASGGGGTSDPASTGALRGIPASPGTYRGPARIIRTESEFGKLQAGDVLVCPTTSPVWSVLFPNVGALVTDTGGALSHPAIIAREFGVPAVVATGNATELARDGQILVVDGAAGTVRTEP
jgi:pyruvate,water dikinase